MKVLCHYTASPSFVHRFADLAPEGVELTVCPVEDLDRYYDLIAESEVLWHFLLPLTASMIDAGASLRLIQKIGIGVNMIDLDAARRHGIAVCNMPGTNAQAVAEATLLLMLGALRRAAQVDRATRAGDGWALQTALQDDSSEVAGRSVGLVGLGAIAQRLAPVLVALGARVLYVSRTPKPGAVGERVPLERLLAESDIVSLHLPLTSETERLIDAAAIARMKPGAVIVNTARTDRRSGACRGPARRPHCRRRPRRLRSRTRFRNQSALHHGQCRRRAAPCLADPRNDGTEPGGRPGELSPPGGRGRVAAPCCLRAANAEVSSQRYWPDGGRKCQCFALRWSAR